MMKLDKHLFAVNKKFRQQYGWLITTTEMFPTSFIKEQLRDKWYAYFPDNYVKELSCMIAPFHSDNNYDPQCKHSSVVFAVLKSNQSQFDEYVRDCEGNEAVNGLKLIRKINEDNLLSKMTQIEKIMIIKQFMEDLDVKFEMNEPIGLEYNGIEVERPILMNRKFNIFLFTATSNETKDKDDWRRAVFIPQIVQQTNRLSNKYYDTCLSIVLCGDEVVVYLGNYTFHQFDRTKGSFSFSIIDYCEHLNICGFGWIYTKLVSLVEYFRVHLESFENDIPILYTATRDPSIFGILHKRLEMNKKLEKKKSKELGTFKVTGIEKEKKLSKKMNNLKLLE